MENKLKQMQDILKLQKTIAEARESQKIKTVEIQEEIEEVQVVNTLPTTYLSANQLKLSAKELTHTLSYADRLKQDDERYEKLQISEEKAKKIRRNLLRLTTGTAAVVPLKCNGESCSFKTTCLTEDTKILMKNGSYRSIKDIKVNDKVYSFNVASKKIVTDTVINSGKTGEEIVYRIKTKYGNSIEATSNHDFLCQTTLGNLNWNSIDNNLSVGFNIVVDDFNQIHNDEAESIGDGYIDTIISIEQIGIRDVYDITIKNNSNFIANNFIVHNCPYFLEGVAPVGLACQPPTSKVLTVDHGYVQMVDLDPTKHKVIHIVTRDGSKQSGGTGKVRASGSTFRKASRPFTGKLVKVVTTTGKSYESTPDHISYIRWNKEAVRDKIAVYLMYKEGKFRIGRTKLLQGGNTTKSHTYGGFSHRCVAEGAEKGWILGVYPDTVTAHMAEEYWSIVTQTPKIMFVASEKSTKHNGFTKWVTNEQIEEHFKSFDMNQEKYEKILKELNLDFNYPLYTKDGDKIDNSVSFNAMTRVRSCNLIPGLMDVYVLKSIKDEKAFTTRSTKDQWDFETIQDIKLVPYTGLVYSLGVDENPNYITDSGIATHNCLVETQLIEYWLEKYQNEFNVDDNSITDMHMIARLCEYDIYDMRVTRYLAENDQTLLVDFISSYDEEGNPISNKATSAAFEVKERIDRLRSKTLKELMATREAKAKIMTTVTNGTTNMTLAQLKQKFDLLVKEKTDLKIVNE